MIKCILIEAGHGLSYPFNYKDCGAVNGKYTERSFNISIARKILEILKSKEELKGVLIQGVGVETNANIVKKYQFANKVIAENRYSPEECIYVAIHINSLNAKSTGFEVWAKSNKSSYELSEHIIQSNNEYKLFADRGVKLTKNNRHKGLYIDNVKSTACLIENGFLSNAHDLSVLNQQIDRVAEMNAHGIMEYIRNLK
jgi:N-acetylmuramoyl-L-alanine amidase